MTLKIDRETLPCTPEQFAQAVDQHIAALTEYNEHLKGVEADAADASIPHENKRVAFPPPDAPMVVMQAIGRREDGTLFADYELVGPSLEVRKQRLAHLVSEAEHAELAKITPPGKVRYYQMREQAILREDSERWNEHQRMVEAGTLPSDFVSFVTDTRADEDSRLLDEQEGRRRKEQAIQFWAAKQHHDIEDLTEETVDGWQMEGLAVG